MSSAPADAVDLLDDFTDRMTRLRPGIEEIVPAAEEYEAVPAIQLAAATLWLSAQTDVATTNASRHLARVHEHARGLTEREQAASVALGQWLDGQTLATAEALEALTRQWPNDLLALKSLEFQYYVLGYQHVAERFLAHVESVVAPDCADPDVLAVWAFAAEHAGKIDRAIELGDRALDLEVDLPWAHHAIAHALIGRGNDERALGRLLEFEPLWKGDGPFIHSHNAWHLAVAHLDQLDADAARVLFDDVIWKIDPDMVSVQIDAISLLWRLELGGWDAGDERWDAVADHVEPLAGETYMPFLSAHHAVVLARTERTEALSVLLDAVHQRADGLDAEATRVWAPVGAGLVEACAAYARGDLTKAVVLLEPVIDQVPAGGGSDAQNDVFRQTYLASLIGAGRTSEASSYLATMTGWKSARSALDDAWTARL